jgi:hypothetical protein
MEDLGAKLNALTAVNDEILALIASMHEHSIVCGYSFKLECSLGQTGEDTGDGPWIVTSVPTIETVGRVLGAWEYSGEDLGEPDDLFNDRIDYSLKSYNDVVRLSQQVPIVGRKYLRLADQPGNREDLRLFLTNLERLQVAIGELHELTMDVSDPHSDDKTIQEGMGELVAAFHKVSSRLPEAVTHLDFSSQEVCHPVDLEKLKTVELDISRNRLDLPAKKVRVGAAVTLRAVLDVVGPMVSGEAEKMLHYRFRRVAARKNKTKRPMEAYLTEDYDKTVAELGLLRKRRLYLEQHEDPNFPRLDIVPGSVFIQIRFWDGMRPTTVGDFVLPRTTTMQELRALVSKALPESPKHLVIIEEETESVANILSSGLDDDGPDKTLGDCAIISGDIVHVEPFDSNFHLDEDGNLGYSLVKNYFWTKLAR